MLQAVLNQKQFKVVEKFEDFWITLQLPQRTHSLLTQNLHQTIRQIVCILNGPFEDTSDRYKSYNLSINILKQTHTSITFTNFTRGL